MNQSIRLVAVLVCVTLPQFVGAEPPLLNAPYDADRAKTGQAEWVEHLKSERGIVTPTGFEFVLIPPGEYLRGSSDADIEFLVQADPAIKPEFLSREKPQHRVRITKPFYLSKFETTQSQFQTVMGRNPSWYCESGKGANKVKGMDTTRFPVEQVSWFDCVEFCNKLSEAERKTPCYRLEVTERINDSIFNGKVTLLPGNGYRLPTEAEWEHACRAGTTTPFYFGMQCNGEQANVDGRRPFSTTPGPSLRRPCLVGMYAANRFGLHDMCGNVWEWCQDGADETGYGRFKNEVNIDPEGSFDIRDRVLRGGCHQNGYLGVRSADRYVCFPGRYDNFGFRIAISRP